MTTTAKEADKIVCESREAWLAERRNGIGASDVPAVLGVNPWRTPLAVWAEKCDLLPADEAAQENEAMQWGLILERPVLEEFARRTGREVVPHDQTTMYVHSRMPFLRCTPDAIQVVPTRTCGNLQIKTSGAHMTKEWIEGPPLFVSVQVQAELAVTGLEWGTIAVLLGGQRLLWFDVERDDAFIAAMLPHLDAFWSSVQNRTPPAVDSSLVTSRILQQLHPDDDGSEIILPSEAMQWDQELASIKEQIDCLDDRKRLLENQFKSAIGAATFGTFAGGRYSLKTQESSEYVAKASKFRVLRKLKGMK